MAQGVALVRGGMGSLGMFLAGKGAAGWDPDTASFLADEERGKPASADPASFQPVGVPASINRVTQAFALGPEFAINLDQGYSIKL